MRAECRDVPWAISPDASAIAAASKALLDAAVARRQAVRLCWPYGGHSMEVAGDALGGWHVRAPLDRSSPSGCSTTIKVHSSAALSDVSHHHAPCDCPMMQLTLRHSMQRCAAHSWWHLNLPSKGR